ncbi:MAG: MFS transporter [Bdellovibrionota bacterium]
MSKTPAAKGRSPIFIIFTTVLVDLIGFGIVIPLIALYGRHYGAGKWQLPILGGAFSLMQFFFAPFWGSLSDRIGRRPVLLVSLAGSTISYFIFSFAPSFTWLLAARAFGGVFAANISTAQAYIADVTKPEERAKGMGLIGAAFGIGFTLGPPIGGIAAAKVGLWAPGLIAGIICGLNFLLAVFRLPESLPPAHRTKQSSRSLAPLNFAKLVEARRHGELWFFFLAFFLITFGFSNMEQTFSLLFQNKFALDTGEAGLKTGMVLMFAGVLGAVIQGGLIRKWAPRYGERRLLMWGLVLNFIAMAIFPFVPTYGLYFAAVVPMAFGSGLINPSLGALTSRSVGPKEQGVTMGVSQGLGSLARALGPFCGLLTFALDYRLPYAIAASIAAGLLGGSSRVLKG